MNDRKLKQNEKELEGEGERVVGWVEGGITLLQCAEKPLCKLFGQKTV